jgi:hypothetical protein
MLVCASGSKLINNDKHSTWMPAMLLHLRTTGKHILSACLYLYQTYDYISEQEMSNQIRQIRPVEQKQNMRLGDHAGHPNLPAILGSITTAEAAHVL